MRSCDRGRSRPAWLLLLLLAVAGLVSVPAARPVPAPSHFEDQRPAVRDGRDTESLAAISSDVSGSQLAVRPVTWPSPLETRPDPVDPGPLLARAPGAFFALHQRPPPSPSHT